MQNHELKKHTLHALAVYSALAGVPRALHIGDIIDSALNNNSQQLVIDLESLMINCVLDTANFLLDKVDSVNKDKWKLTTRSKLKSLRNYPNKLDAKNECITIINEINGVLGLESIPIMEQK